MNGNNNNITEHSELRNRHISDLWNYKQINVIILQFHLYISSLDEHPQILQTYSIYIHRIYLINKL